MIYAATKMGVVGLTRSIAWEGMRYGIKANAIAPAAFDSRMYAEMNPEGDAALTGRPPDLEGVAGGRRIHGPVHRKPGDPAGVGTGSPQLPGHRRGLLRDGGYYCRFAISHSDGALLGLEPTVEDVVAHFDEIRGAGTIPNEVDGEALVWGLQSFAPHLLPLVR